jgi:hypothetical protein
MSLFRRAQLVCRTIGVIFGLTFAVAMTLPPAGGRDSLLTSLILVYLPTFVIVYFGILVCPKCEWPIMRKPNKPGQLFWFVPRKCPKCGEALDRVGPP